MRILGICAAVMGLLFLVSPALAIDDVLLRHIDTLLDFVGVFTANCVQHYEDEITPQGRAKLNFSDAEIGAYCVCSTKLLVRQMKEADFQNLEAGSGLPMTLMPALKQAHLDCAKKVWDARQHR